jgi:hypothetical protein
MGCLWCYAQVRLQCGETFHNRDSWQASGLRKDYSGADHGPVPVWKGVARD